ncbi:hypothetical protein OESDEN_16709 [Oesophagostomum dentatum]|uniref:Uncharacterized protein n=1 Tax=Oesophagostomum dentatum TaxID=61180 RepID=A0A0B1SK62_OESDE|nr:hypothetical protein OESDEN_16709 [Oesophagostomum dentatum]
MPMEELNGTKKVAQETTPLNQLSSNIINICSKMTLAAVYATRMRNATLRKK